MEYKKPVLIVTALRAEANPLIEHFGLQPVKNSHVKLYQKDSIRLLIFGLGKKKADASVTEFLNIFPVEYLLVNIGIAGGNPKVTDIGDMYAVHRIHDESSGREWFPDMLIKHELKEMSITTVESAVTDGAGSFTGLVDMEASAVFESAVKSIPSHRMVFLKIVSDTMDESEFSGIDVPALIESHLSEIERIIRLYQHSGIWNEPILEGHELSQLSAGINTMKLTATQSEELHRLAEGKKLRSGNVDKLWPMMEHPPESKKERNDRFEQIRQFLSS